jgi:hypothetical protein
VGGSGQAESFVSAANVTVAVSSRLLYLSTGFSLVVAIPVGIGTYCVNRLVSDLGVRSDVTKVPVEKLVRTGSDE